jgi:phospholipid/cholesterol/gamma-HCH transport system substrate-binding protein
METRAPYALIGLFVLTVIAAVFGFVYWLHNGGGLAERTVYRVQFANTVSGLLKGAAVLFNGIRVGEVTDLRFDTDRPERVMATIAVDAGTPVRTDTKAGLDFQGLTGVPIVTLQGGTAPLPPAPRSQPHILVADPQAGQSMTNAARDALRRLDSILTDNADSIRSTIGNLNTFTGALARNSDKLDGIVSGLERLTSGGASNAERVVYDLTAPSEFPSIDAASRGQLAVAEPSSLIMLDSRKILVRPSPGDDATFARAEWSDNVPKLLQSKIIQTFENAGLSRNVSRSVEAGIPDKVLAIDVRKFGISTTPEPIAEVEFSARILAENGRIVEARVFRSSAPVAELKAAAAAAAIDRAFGQSARELVTWVQSRI